MLNNSVVKSRTVLGICITVLAVVSGLTSCGGATSPRTSPNNKNTSSAPSAPIIRPSTITAEANKCATAPTRGTVYYYCDCATGAAGNCVAGNNANPGTDPTAPKRTLEAAASMISSFTGDTNHTVALCKGGSFTSAAQYGESINRSGCTAGTDCDDIREYASPVFTSSAAPLLTEPYTGAPLFNFMGNYGGVRVMNLSMKDTTGKYTGTAMFAGYGAHDITMCNNTIDGFGNTINMAGNETVNPSLRTKIIANTIINSGDIAILGGSDGGQINYNYLQDNGIHSTGVQVQTHSIYVSGHILYSNMQIIGNYVRNTISCAGVEIVGHGQFDYLTVTDNVINNDVGVISNTCFGIGFGSAPAYPEANFFTNSTFSRNTIINAGAVSMSIANAPGAIIEDNLIVTNYAYGGGLWQISGFGLSNTASRTTPYVDGVNTAMVVRNNTIWFGPAVTGGAVGIDMGIEGTGHIVANNTVVYSAATIASNRDVGCYAYELPNSAFAFINNNHCYSAAAGAYWRVTDDSSQQVVKDSTRMSLSAWQSYASAQGWDSASVGGAPNFVNASSTYGSYDFHPNANPALPLSPLLGAGSHANAPTGDLSGTSFSDPPAIGAYEKM